MTYNLLTKHVVTHLFRVKKLDFFPNCLCKSSYNIEENLFPGLLRKGREFSNILFLLTCSYFHTKIQNHCAGCRENLIKNNFTVVHDKF